MTRPLAAFAVAVGLVAAAALGDSPKISSSSPFGVRRGEPTEVTLFGSNLEGKARLIAPFSAEVTAVSADAASWKFRIAPAANTPVGVYVCRVRTDDGLSSPFLFSVGQVPQVLEKEDNSSFELAQPIPSPVVVEGTSEGNDVDYFRFPGKKGQRIVVDAQCSRIGSGVDPSIRLTTAAHTYVASADDTPGLITDARLTTVLPEDTDYVIELSDSRYQGTGKAIYRLLVGPVPVVDEVFPLGGRNGETIGLELKGGTLPGPSIASATLIPNPDADPNSFRPRLTNHTLGIAGLSDPVLDVESIPPLVVDRLPELREPVEPGSPTLKAFAPVVFNGRIGKRGEEDKYIVGVTPGQKLRIEVAAADLGSALDGILQVRGPDGAVLATADDTPSLNQSKAKAAAKKAAALNSPDPLLNFTVPAGMTEITLTLRDLRGEGGAGYPYRLTVEPIAATSFQVAPVEDQISIPRGGTAAIAVTVTRLGFDGPITLTVANLPPGLSVRPGRVNPGQTVGSLTISATPEASVEIANLKLIGEGAGPSGPIVAMASKSITFAEQATLATNVLVQEGLPASTSLPTAITLESPATPVEVVHGYGANVPIKAIRAAGSEDVVLTFGSLPLPAGFTIGASTIPAKANEGGAIVNAAVEAPLGPSIIALTAKGSIVGKEKILAAPAVTLEVVRPAAVELAAPSTEVKAGQTVEVKGKVARKGPFKEPVTVKLDGLPAGVKAEPATVTVPPDQTEFTLKLVADAKAAAGQATAKVALAFQINKKDYPVPTAPLAVKVLSAP
jgi:hypothetical protein